LGLVHVLVCIICGKKNRVMGNENN